MTKARILIADDSKKLLSALRIQLEHRGYEVTACTDAYMALAQAQKQRPDVIILDIRMPAGDGFSVLERMSKLPELQGTPVIYITGERSTELDMKAEQLGACGILRKPLSLAALFKLIDGALQRRTSCRQEGEPQSAIFDVTVEMDTRPL